MELAEVELLLQQGLLASALRLSELNLPSSPSESNIASFLLHARCLAENGEIPAAIALAEQLRVTSGSTGQSVLGSLYLRAERFDEAYTALRQCVQHCSLPQLIWLAKYAEQAALDAQFAADCCKLAISRQPLAFEAHEIMHRLGKSPGQIVSQLSPTAMMAITSIHEPLSASNPNTTAASDIEAISARALCCSTDRSLLELCNAVLPRSIGAATSLIEYTVTTATFRQINRFDALPIVALNLYLCGESQLLHQIFKLLPEPLTAAVISDCQRIMKSLIDHDFTSLLEHRWHSAAFRLYSRLAHGCILWRQCLQSMEPAVTTDALQHLLLCVHSCMHCLQSPNMTTSSASVLMSSSPPNLENSSLCAIESSARTCITTAQWRACLLVGLRAYISILSTMVVNVDQLPGHSAVSMVGKRLIEVVRFILPHAQQSSQLMYLIGTCLTRVTLLPLSASELTDAAQKATRAFEKSLQLDPTSIECSLALAVLYQRQNRMNDGTSPPPPQLHSNAPVFNAVQVS